jgi:predicted nucleic acid-binding protein
LRLVVDASIAIAYFVPERFSKGALLWLSGPHSLLAPDFLVVEAINVLWKKMRRGEITRAEAEGIMTAMAAGDIPLLPASRYGRTAWRMAVELDHSLYDCFYLALAVAEGGVLVTADRGFHRRVTASRWADRIAWVEDSPPA